MSNTSKIYNDARKYVFERFKVCPDDYNDLVTTFIDGIKYCLDSCTYSDENHITFIDHNAITNMIYDFKKIK